MPLPFRFPIPDSATKPRSPSFTLALAAALCLVFPLSNAAHAQADIASSATTQSGQELQRSTRPATPADLYGRLYHDVELAQIFPDSKTFADMLPNARPSEITAAYDHWREQHAGERDEAARKAALTQFVNHYFTAPPQTDDHYVSDPDQDVVGHIDTLWDVLTRQPDARPHAYSSLLPLPYAYVVPGGRFNEIYYWDSYFIMLGLEASGRHALALDELNNFATLIDRYGHIANGNRTYYLSRSQPPFFAQMVSLAAQRDGDAVYLRYLPQLREEYDYWMAGAQTLEPGHATRHVVRLPDGTLLNRYWDARNRPRDES